MSFFGNGVVDVWCGGCLCGGCRTISVADMLIYLLIHTTIYIIITSIIYTIIIIIIIYIIIINGHSLVSVAYMLVYSGALLFLGWLQHI